MEAIREIIPVLPKRLHKLFKDYFKPGYFDNKHFETPGDLQELKTLINHQILGHNHFMVGYQNTNIEMFLNLNSLALASWGLMSYQDFSEFEACKAFRAQYPKLFETIIVWGWS
jgi:hypothetical protein